MVTANQLTIRAVLTRVPWKQCREVVYARGRGHGRRETRSARALTITDLDLGCRCAVRAVVIVRHRTAIRTGKTTRQSVYARTDLASHQSRPAKIGRSQWGIDAVHHARDTTSAEDASKIRTGRGPANMATLWNLAINTLRAAGLREASYQPFTRPLDLIERP